MREASARILVVDDERSLREFLEIFFRREGYDVRTAASVDEARSRSRPTTSTW